VTKVVLGVLASGPAADAVTRHVPQLVADRFASRLFAKDATLWGPEAEPESAKRLSWVTLGRTSRPLVGEVAALRDHLAEQGVDHVVLCGMGGSSLAPEVICATAGVEITILAHKDTATGGILFTVADNGPGIPPEYHELIFRKFERAKQPEVPRVRSSGLGLAFCKLAVEVHGGRIWVRSIEGKGSQFHIALPVHPPPQPLAAHRAS